MPAIGEQAPQFSLPSTVGGEFDLRRALPKVSFVIIAFYPKDNTSGWARELASFREAYSRLRIAGAEVVGISADTIVSHQRFAANLGLPFPLLSDSDRKVIAAYGVLNEKGTGARRSVFVTDGSGIIRHANDRYDLAKPAHHSAVLAAVGLE